MHMALLVLGVGVAVSLLWVYTDGRMDSESIQRAIPVIQSDVEDYVITLGHRTAKYFNQAEKAVTPYLEKGIKNGKKVWREGGKQMRQGAKWLSDNYGDQAAQVWDKTKLLAANIWSRVLELCAAVRPHVEQAWEQARPHLQSLGKFIIDTSIVWWNYLYSQFPVFIDWGRESYQQVQVSVQAAWKKVIQAM